jgi:hypothetical protein
MTDRRIFIDAPNAARAGALVACGPAGKGGQRLGLATGDPDRLLIVGQHGTTFVNYPYRLDDGGVYGVWRD